MGMPLDMALACSNHASWKCGLLAFGLPSASNKAKPDRFLLMILPLWNTERQKERVCKRQEREMRKSNTEQDRKNGEWEHISNIWLPCRQQGHQWAYCTVVPWGRWGHGGGGANSQQVHFMSTSILLFLMGMNNVSPQSLTPTDTEAYRSFTNLLSLNWVSHLLYASEVPVVLWFYRFFQV